MTVTEGIDALRAAIESKPRVRHGHFPTPLDEAPRLSRRLGVRVLIKRDDQTGVALGGNKVRKLEFLIGDALAQGATDIVTTGGSQSNHARLAAAFCRMEGLACHLVLDRGVHPEIQGNMLLDELLGARVELLESADPADAVAGMEATAERLRREGKQPYIIPRGGSVPTGATGYAAFSAELIAQLEERGERVTWLYLGTGSTGTHSGTLAGLLAANSPIKLQGISVSRPESLQRPKVIDLTGGTLRHLGLPDTVDEESVRVDDRAVGPGYGIPIESTIEAIRIAALDEGVVLDPVYTGKAMAGLIAHAREGRFGPDDTVVFLHTGGAPALFAYSREVAEALAGDL